jgi:hypothetical protein
MYSQPGRPKDQTGSATSSDDNGAAPTVSPEFTEPDLNPVFTRGAPPPPSSPEPDRPTAAEREQNKQQLAKAVEELQRAVEALERSRQR